MTIADPPANLTTRYSLMGTAPVDAPVCYLGVLVNPSEPPENQMDHHSRSVNQILTWWRVPYIMGRDGDWQVRCLDGGASDRPRFLGQADNLDDAVDIAKAYSAEAHPVVFL
jgi:hypothetical protein